MRLPPAANHTPDWQCHCQLIANIGSSSEQQIHLYLMQFCTQKNLTGKNNHNQCPDKHLTLCRLWSLYSLI